MRRPAPISLLALVALLAVLAAPAAAPAPELAAADARAVSAAAPGRPGLAALRALAHRTDDVAAIATFDGTPTDDHVAAFRSLGLVTQRLEALPLVLLWGTVDEHLAAASVPGVADVYPDAEPLDWHWDRTNRFLGATDVHRDLGITGEGVAIAIVDSGIDASHANLAEPTVENYQLIGPEYLSIAGYDPDPDLATTYLALPFHQGPYSNTDTIGHGTHVAGIAAGDQDAGDPELVGVAPDADLIGYGTGQVVFIFEILAAFDHILQNHERLGIRVVNNSWGSSFALFDPDHPTNVATRALYDAGLVVTFSAGNSSQEMMINPWSVAPWVVSVGSTTASPSPQRSDFSSGGLVYDNSLPIAPDAGGQLTVDGEGLGLYHPDVSAPGSAIVSAGTPTGIGVLSPTQPNGKTSLSGTSMSAPQVAGVVALVLQANPDLTPDQVRAILEVTAAPMAEPFWHVGHGSVDAAAAVRMALDLADGTVTAAELEAASAEADAAVVASRAHRVLRGDYVTAVAPPATVQGSTVLEWSVAPHPEADALRASVAFPLDAGVLDMNLVFSWTLEVLDAAGTVVARTELDQRAGYAQVDLPADVDRTGPFTVRVIGDLHASQPSLLWGGSVTGVVVQLASR